MSAPERQQTESEDTARRILAMVQDVTLEVHPHKRRDLVVELDSALDREGDREVEVLWVCGEPDLQEARVID